MKPLPHWNSYGFLPPGIHPASLDHLEDLLQTSPQRKALWNKLDCFLTWTQKYGNFSHAYLGGGFVSSHPTPRDIDLILEAMEPYPLAFEAMIPFFEMGLDHIYKTYSVHLHFWAKGFPPSFKDYRCFFQYAHPNDCARYRLPLDARKGIVRLPLLSNPTRSGKTNSRSKENLTANPEGRSQRGALRVSQFGRPSRNVR